MLETADAPRKLSKRAYAGAVGALRVELINLQYDVAHSSRAVIITVAGDDRLSVVEAVDVLSEWMDTRYLPVRAFGLPSARDREHPWQWRYWEALPGKGEMALFAATSLPAPIRGAFSGRLDDEHFASAVSKGVEFEATLAEDGVTMIKLWLHLPGHAAAEHLDQFFGDHPDPDAHLDERDRLMLERRDEIEPVVDRYLRATSGPGREWLVIDASKHRHRDLAVAEAVRDGLRAALDGDGDDTETSGLPSAAAASAEAWSRAQRMPDGPQRLADVDLSATVDYGAYRDELEVLQRRLRNLWTLASGELRMKAVLVFEGWDAAGKGGVIRRVHRPLRAGTYLVVPIAAPTEHELAHHYLWRFWTRLPRPSKMTIFDRSWYGRVLVERVEGFATEAAWRRAYSEIRSFEQQQVDHGTVLAKFWLHIDADEQLRRFEAREETPYKKYKITTEDYRNRSRWDDYVLAADEMFAETSTLAAPWTLVAANDKRAARLTVLRTVCDRLEAGVTAHL